MSKVFISYRRQDSAAVAGRIYDHLRAHFGDGRVFIDIDGIPLGEDFRTYIAREVGQCGVVLAVIGPRWVGEADAHRRLDDPADFVRIELETALGRGIPVIPILIDGAEIPTEADLPGRLADLVFRNGIALDHGRDFRTHVGRLIQEITNHFERAKTVARPSRQQGKQDAPLSNAKEDGRARHQNPSRSDPLPKPDPQRAKSPKSKAPPNPAGPVEAPRVPAPRAPVGRNSGWLKLLFVIALILLAFMGGVIYPALDRGTVKMSGMAPEETAEAGKRKATYPSPREAGTSKPASPTAQVQSPTPKPPSPVLEREWTNSIGMKFVRIEAGKFMMGSTKEQVDRLMKLFPDSKRELFNDEQPQHAVKIGQPFSLGMYPVAQGQYEAVMGNNPSYFKGSKDLPVENVSWIDAVTFCNKLSEMEQQTPWYRIDGTEVTLVKESNGYRLPTEAEWEYACRAGSTTLYPFGDDINKLGEYAWYSGNSENKTHPVGQKKPNAWGLHDMLGNVWEWCGDWYGESYYASSPGSDPPGPSRSDARVFRGGGWRDAAGYCRAAYRYRGAPAYTNYNLGLRLARVQSAR